MLELRKYAATELREYLHTNDNSQTDNKLERYEVKFSKSGRGDKAIYNIKEITQPFKVFAVFDLGVEPHTDFTKLSFYILEMFSIGDIAGMGFEMIEERFRETDYAISRQTISKYLKILTDNNLVSVSTSDFVYYRVYKKFGCQTHDVITREEYAEAWKHYWMLRNEYGYDSAPAFQSMYNKFGGAPRKQGIVEPNGIYNQLIDNITEMALETVAGKAEPFPCEG